MGYGNDDLECSLCMPAITSIVVPARQIGREAATLLDAMLSHRKFSKHPVAVPALDVAVRQSTNILSVTDPHVLAAANYIQEHACDGITAADVARHMVMSKRAMEYRFTASLGRSPLAEIHRVQIERAKVLLTGSNMKVSSVVAKVGMQQHRSFRRIFWRHVGMSPNDYRAKMRK
jgi:LacI family transcriptional regulator